MPKKKTVNDNSLEQGAVPGSAQDEAIAALTYEQAFEKLEDIVDRMGSASVPLEELMSLYEQGMALGAHCEKLLSGYEARLEKVSKQTLTEELEAIENASACPEENEDEDF